MSVRKILKIRRAYQLFLNAYAWRKLSARKRDRVLMLVLYGHQHGIL